MPQREQKIKLPNWFEAADMVEAERGGRGGSSAGRAECGAVEMSRTRPWLRVEE